MVSKFIRPLWYNTHYPSFTYPITRAGTRTDTDGLTDYNAFIY